MPSCIRQGFEPPQPLVQIRQGLRTTYDHLSLLVQTGSEGWIGQVRDASDGRTLYSAQRCSLGAAKTAVSEFALFRTAGDMSRKRPEAVAQELQWNPFWGVDSPRISA